MPSPDFKQFQADLLRSGIAPRHVRRIASELQEHFEDLVEDELGRACDRRCATQQAAIRIGDLGDVAHAIQRCPELHSWSSRYPRLAVIVYPLTCVALLPAIPVIAGVQHAPQIARWGACLLGGGLVTTAMFLLLQLSISLS